MAQGAPEAVVRRFARGPALNSEEFFRRVRHDFPYAIEGDTEQLVRTVLHVLENHVSEGEWKDLKARMPASMSAVMPS